MFICTFVCELSGSSFWLSHLYGQSNFQLTHGASSAVAATAAAAGTDVAAVAAAQRFHAA